MGYNATEINSKSLEPYENDYVAVRDFEKILNKSTHRFGFFISVEYPFLMGSWDRSLYDEGLVELKCSLIKKCKPGAKKK